jgi:hypothetical protein
LIDDGECKHSRVGGAKMMTRQNLSKITDVALLSLLALAAVLVTAGIASSALAQAADAQAQINSFVFAPQRLTPEATSDKTVRSSAGRGTKGWIALHRPDSGVVYIKLDQIVFVMSARNTGADERARSKIQLLNGHLDVRESVEEVMQIIENDSLLAKDGT